MGHFQIIFHIFFTYFKNNYIKYKIIKNKVLDIKIIFKTYIKILKIFYILKYTFIM